MNTKGGGMRLRSRVRAAREARKLSQSRLAREAGVSRPTLRAIEQDDGHEPTGAVMTALCRALDDPTLFWWEAAPELAKAAS